MQASYNLNVTADDLAFIIESLEYLDDSMAPWDYDNTGGEEKLIAMIKKLKRFEQAEVLSH